jgi:hypothetical protein
MKKKSAVVGAVVFSTRAKREHRRIKQFGRHLYSWDHLTAPIPKTWRFRTRRAAKRYFQQDPLPVRTQDEFVAVFGSPNYPKLFPPSSTPQQ